MVERKSFILAMILVSSAKAAPGNFLNQEITTEEFSITGGSDADITEVPYQVELVLALETMIHGCGGSIIAPDIILTAAHCVDGVPIYELKVRAGTNKALEGDVLIDVAKIIMHPSTNRSNDVAVLRLAEKLEFGPTIKAVELPESGKPPAIGSDAIVSGWGLISTSPPENPKSLQKVTVSIIEGGKVCEEALGLGATVDDSMLCAGKPGQGSCFGDSGGPLVQGNVQYGIVSWGRSDCHEPNVYANVANLRQWIDQAIKDLQ